MSYKNYTDEQIIESAKAVKSMAQLLKSLGLRFAGGNYINMKRNLQRLNIDTSHWTGMAWNKGQQLKNYSEYTRAGNIKKHLVKTRGSACELCGLDAWRNQPILLELHHIDGDRTNNQESNLELLCPNCHSTTGNWRNRARV